MGRAESAPEENVASAFSMDLWADLSRLPVHLAIDRRLPNPLKPMKILPLFLTAMAVLGLSATAQAQNGSSAVLDIDLVARELGVDQTVLTELQQIEASLNSQLAQVRNNLQSQMNQLEARAGQQRTQQIQAQLVEANRKLNADFNAVRAQAQNQLAGARVQRINDFRDKLRPIALEVAKAKGFSVVLTKTPEVYAFDEAVDITQEVIAKAKAEGLDKQLSMPEEPATNGAGESGATEESGASESTAPAPAPSTGEATPNP